MSRAMIGVAACVLVAVLSPLTYAQEIPAPNSAPVTAAPAQTAPASSVTAPSQPKKVWTNEDMNDLHSNSEISSIGRTDVRNTRQAGRTAAGPRRNANWYRDQITRLKTQLATLDAQIVQLQSAINGTPTGDTKTSTRPTGVKGGTWGAELAKTQAKRDNVAGQIEALRDDARHNGIPPNTLP